MSKVVLKVYENLKCPNCGYHPYLVQEEKVEGNLKYYTYRICCINDKCGTQATSNTYSTMNAGDTSIIRNALSDWRNIDPDYRKYYK